MKKRILVAVNNDANIDVRILNELRVLKKAGLIIGLICTGTFKKLPGELSSIPVWRINAKSWLYKFQFISSTSNSMFHKLWEQKLITVAKEFSPDLLHVHDLFMGISAERAAANLGIPFVIDLHENYPEAFRRYSWTKKFPHRLFVNPNYWFENRSKILESAAGIIVLDKPYGLQLKAKYPRIDEIPMVDFPNVPSLDEFNPVARSKEKSAIFRVFYFGMISKIRNLDVVSSAIKKLRVQGRNVEFIIAGSVTKHDGAYFKQEVLLDGVRHIPWVKLPELGDIIHEMDVCICPIEKNPQHESGVANKIFQYMHFGKPLLVSDCRPQMEIVQSAECGLAYPAENAAVLAEKIAWMKDNPAEIAKMGANGRKAIERKFNTSIQGQKILELYDHVLGNMEFEYGDIAQNASHSLVQDAIHNMTQ